jgi:Flp pilus assembly protein TadG
MAGMKLIHKVRCEAGQAVVEFAAVMIPFAVLFVLALDGALFFYGYVTAANATREGARCAAVGASTENIQARVSGELPCSAPSVTVTRTDTNADGTTGVGDQVTVSARWTYNWVTPLSTFGLPGGTTKTYTSEMRLETGKTDGPCD